MTTFIRCDSGSIVNLADVEMILPVDAAEADPMLGVRTGDLLHYALHMRNGGRHTVGKNGFNPDLLGYGVVPAGAPVRAACILVSDTSDRPAARDVLVEWRQVVAWHVPLHDDRTAPIPVLVGRPAYREIVFIELPDGHLCWAGTVTAANLDEAREIALRDAQSRWDAEFGEPPSTPPAAILGIPL